jgi:hypothetical protein
MTFAGAIRATAAMWGGVARTTISLSFVVQASRLHEAWR